MKKNKCPSWDSIMYNIRWRSVNRDSSFFFFSFKLALISNKRKNSNIPRNKIFSSVSKHWEPETFDHHKFENYSKNKKAGIIKAGLQRKSIRYLLHWLWRTSHYNHVTNNIYFSVFIFLKVPNFRNRHQIFVLILFSFK